ncbi:MAG TPA: hypothetical protein VGA45_16880 [Actinomycetota bacterium]
MARPRRMGAFNALDELLPGPDSEPERRALGAVSGRRAPEREPEPEAGRSWERQRGRREPRAEPEEARGTMGFNALDELLPGPMAARRRLQLVPERPPDPRGQGSRHLSTYNPLDDLQPEPPAPKARVSLRVEAELLEAVRDATAYLSQDQERVTLGELAEEALRAELHRLAAEHNSGRPFPPRPPKRRNPGTTT